MTRKVHRPLCRHPLAGAVLTIAVCLALIVVVKLLSLPSEILWLAAVFGICGILFGILAATSPGTTLTIDDTTVTRSGRIFGGTLSFDEIVDAQIARDPDAQNYQQITLRNREGKTLLIDPRFLNPDVDGLVDLLHERLRLRGVELTGERSAAPLKPNATRLPTPLAILPLSVVFLLDAGAGPPPYAPSASRFGAQIINGGPVVRDEVLAKKRASGALIEAEPAEIVVP